MNRALLLAALATALAPDPAVYRPKLAVPETLEPFLKQLEPGSDGFGAEREAGELQARLDELGEHLRASAAQGGDVAGWLLAPEFRGGHLVPRAPSSSPTDTGLEVRRATELSQKPSLDARAFGAELQRLTSGMKEVTVTEFLITSIDVAGTPPTVRTDVRYDIVGTGTQAWRMEHVGAWQMAWRRNGADWLVVEWTSTAHVTSRAATPIFTEITQPALGSNASFAGQLGAGLDVWTATLDSVLTRDSNGHHGVSVGDADGDGLEDLYVAQPAGLPNRLFRGRGDSTFEDVTEQAGLAVLDDTAQSLFADVDNDGDQDLVLATGTAPLLFVNDGRGRFSHVADAFVFRRPLQGVLTSIAMADYDRDGFLDLYLCVYSYFFGAGEEKAGTPAPYHDARNGPPGVLFRNDGRGRFVDATEEAGVDAGNDRYHFAAAWADYDNDRWPDLFVANDFGTKNLYRNRGRASGKVTFEDVAGKAGVLDHGAGMSAAFLDYDNDGLLDVYAGNMWSASGLRVTSSPAFMADASPEVRALYRRHARGNSLFRNLGDGRFEDTTLDARAEMGRWAWSSDALDFDSDGWEDLYVVNGMLTRDTRERDLEGFFWRQVVARSPLTRVKGTPYDDAWRAINQLLMHRSIASRQRNVLLRNDGRGHFDEVSGAAGLDLDQDGRSFAVFDIDRDGDSDLAIMAARQAPHLRVFRNDYRQRGASLAIRLVGRESNRDAIGARVTVQTERLNRTKIVQAGSGFLSQHSKELLFGLGPSERVVKMTVTWPSGRQQELTDIPLDCRLQLVEGGAPTVAPFVSSQSVQPGNAAAGGAASLVPDSTWLYEPFPAPDFSHADVDGETRSLASVRGRTAIVLFWSSGVAASRSVRDALVREAGRLKQAGIAAFAIAVDAPASREAAVSYAILHRHLFMNRPDLRLPTAMLLDRDGRVRRMYRDRFDWTSVVRDAASMEVSPAEGLRRALPFAGIFYSPIPARNYLPYGRSLLDEGLDASAIAVFDRAARANPSASTLYRLGTLLARTGEIGRARDAFARALALQPDLAEASNDLGALLAQGGDLDGAITRFRAALTAAPEYPDALNNLGYALLLTGRHEEARQFYEKALGLQPDFPEALNNLGLLFGRAGELDRAERYFREALALRSDYGEAANNLALILVARGESSTAVALLDSLLAASPQFEGAYITLAKIHFKDERPREGIAALERLLQRNPRHPVALELLRQYRPR